MNRALHMPISVVEDMVCENDALNILLPMHTRLDQSGILTYAAPTFAKLLRSEGPLTGKPLLDLIKFKHPKNINTYQDLPKHFAQPLTAVIKKQSQFDLKAVAVPVPNGEILINFAFGTSLKTAVEAWGLTGQDFSPSDPSVEMLYVIEVQSALLQESRSLNDRLNGQREEAEEKAYTDPLTGLPNRRALERYIKRLCKKRLPQGFAILQIDLDHFKSVNDTLGHAAGDRVLQEVALILMNETRSSDIVVRTGGDEFVLVLEALRDQKHLKTIAKRIIQKIERPIYWENQECRVSASIGIVRCQARVETPVDTFLKAADEALYQSKENGRGRFCFSG